ncbi:hypothetical protein PoB_003607900 [Plakobranchus ocellatus]|uniref:Uncharacterized protein n=1 Tax=Plakobranchus ocellatus TaxID=259542 RepID=A0AAV4AP57_9GAST|nr:hypothetical protein PoB_003607900 [Plakobranchus ocellatus]
MVSMINVCILALTLAVVTAKPLERERRQTYGQPLETPAETRIENEDLYLYDEDYYDFYDNFDSRQPLETTDETDSEDLAQNSDDFMSGLSSDQVSYYRAWLRDQKYTAHGILGRSRHLLNHASVCQKLLLEISDPEDFEKAQKAIDALTQAIKVAQRASEIILENFEPTTSSLEALGDVCDVADGFDEWKHFAFPILIPKSASIDFTNTKNYNSCYQVWTRGFFIEVDSNRLCGAAADQRILDLVKDTDMAN